MRVPYHAANHDIFKKELLECLAVQLKNRTVKKSIIEIFYYLPDSNEFPILNSQQMIKLKNVIISMALVAPRLNI